MSPLQGRVRTESLRLDVRVVFDMASEFTTVVCGLKLRVAGDRWYGRSGVGPLTGVLWLKAPGLVNVRGNTTTGPWWSPVWGKHGDAPVGPGRGRLNWSCQDSGPYLLESAETPSRLGLVARSIAGASAFSGSGTNQTGA